MIALGEFVSLQATTPGMPDTGNFNISGVGLFGSTVSIDPTGDPVVSINTDVSGGDGIEVDGTGSGRAIQAYTGSGVGLQAGAADDGIGIDALTVPSTGVIGAGQAVRGRLGGSNVHLYSGAAAIYGFADEDQTGPAGRFDSWGTGPALMTGSGLFSLRNDSHLDGATASRLCLSDTNTAATLSNACIAFVPQADAAGRLQVSLGGTDNDTPGSALVVTFDPGFGLMSLGDPDSVQTAFSDGTNNASIAAYNTSGNCAIDASTGDYNAINASNASDGSAAITGYNANTNAPVFAAQSPTGPGYTAWQVLNNGDSFFIGKLAVGSTTIGAHQLDVTGTMATTGDAEIGGSLTVDVDFLANGDVAAQGHLQGAQLFLSAVGGAAVVGTATLNGTTGVTVNTTSVTANSLIYVTYVASGAIVNGGLVSAGSITPGTSFKIYSVNVLDTNTVSWEIVN